MAKVLLVEDQILTRMGIRMALEKGQSGCSVIAEAGDVKTAIQHLDNNTSIDFVLLDVQLPDGSGVDVMRHIKQLERDIKVLVLSVDNSPQVIMELCNLGIHGFVSKQSDLQTIEIAVDSVTKGNEYFGKDIAEIIDSVIVSKSLTSKIFTDREMDVVRLCAASYSAKQIAEALCISIRTVETHKNNIFKKLGFSSTNELIKYALERGIVNG